MKKTLAILAVISCLQGCTNVEQQEIEASVHEEDMLSMTALPEWSQKALQKHQLHKQYRLGNWMQPNFLSGDFDGDKKEDVAFLAVNIQTGEKGVVILHQDQENSYTAFGAGTAFEEMSDLDWIGIFEKIETGQKVAPTLIDEETGDILGEDSLHAVVLKADAIFIHLKEECGGGIIYREGTNYKWLNVE